MRIRTVLLPVAAAAAITAGTIAAAATSPGDRPVDQRSTIEVADRRPGPTAAEIEAWNLAVWRQAEIDAWNRALFLSAYADAQLGAWLDGLAAASPSSHPWAVCTRQIESHGDYSINTGNGYYGAYQFLRSTWDSTARAAGRYDLVGVLPSDASIADQDALALYLYETAGKGPWGGRC